MASTDGNREDTSTLVNQQRSRKYVVLEGDRIKIYEDKGDQTDEDDYNRSEFVIGRKDSVI